MYYATDNLLTGGYQMKRSKVFAGIMITCAVFMVSTIGPHVISAKAADKVYRMKIQSAYPRGDLSMETMKVFADSAAKNSGDQLQIKVFAEPELVPGDQLFGATKQGVVDMLHGMGGMWGGMVPVGYVEFNLPLAFFIPEEETFAGKAEAIRKFYLNNGFMDLLREEYAKQGLYLLDIHTYGPVPFVLSTKPVKTCADLQGMKIKADGGNIQYHSGVGMLGVQISPTEAYMALKLGTVDAAEWDVSAVTGLNWHEPAPYWVKGMECDHAIGHILVNMKKWNKLSDDLKAAMHKAGEDYWHATVAAYEKELEAVDKLVKEGKVTINILDADCQQKYAESAHKMWEELAGQDEASAKAVQMIKEWRGIK